MQHHQLLTFHQHQTDQQHQMDLYRHLLLVCSYLSNVPFNKSLTLGASPVKFFTVDELLTVNSTLEKMVLAHEIAVDPNFSLDKLPKDPLEEQVKHVMHNAFWDKVSESFSQNPPDYQHAVTLIADLKEVCF